MELGFTVYFSDKTVFVSSAQLQGEKNGNQTVFKTTIDHADIVWTHTPHEGGLLVDLSVSSSMPLGIRRIDSLRVTTGVPKATSHISVLGRTSIQNEIRFPNEFGTDTEYCETAMGLLDTLDGAGLIVAGIAPFENICQAVSRKDKAGRFTFSVKTEYTEDMLTGTALKTERAYIHTNTTISQLFAVYRALLPQSTFPMPKLIGWNTWDYYLKRVTAEDIFENIAVLQKMPFADQLRYIVIDDGWQKSWGDWIENEKFSCGLKTVADRIRAAGFIPGLWMAPVTVQEDSTIFATCNDWLCRDQTGDLLRILDHFYYIDPTHPDARKFILENYRYQYEAGFRLFKMDYIYGLLRVKRFYDKNAAPYGVISRLVADIQSCTGPDAVILGCSLPLECGADIAPSMRIGMDIHNHFDHVPPIARTISWTSIYNNKTTRIDPDFLVVRGEETSDEPLVWEGARNDHVAPPRCKQTDIDRSALVWRHGDQFNALEAETWANLVAISGGNIFLSDRMSALNERGIRIIQNAFQITGDTVEPVYLSDDYRTPSLFKGDRALVLVNWEEIPRTISVSGITQTLCSDKPFTLTDGTLTVTLLPHESFSARYETPSGRGVL